MGQHRSSATGREYYQPEGASMKMRHRTTRELLEELRLRGDILMTVMPTSERGADGSVLSALAGATLKSCTAETLEAKRGE